MRENDIIERPLYISKKGIHCTAIHTRRMITESERLGISEAICDENGKLSPQLKVYFSYTRLTRIAAISPNCYLVIAKHDIDDTLVEIYKIQKLDKMNNKILFEKVATCKESKWDDSSYLKNIKRAITSARNKAKKIYNSQDLD